MKTVVVNEEITPLMERGLLKSGFYPIKMPRHHEVDSAVGSHPDGLIFKYENELLTPASFCDSAPFVFTDLHDRCPNVKIFFTADEPKSIYPHDAPMNAKIIGKYLFAKTDTVSSSVIELAKRHSLTVCHTNQGYPACTVLAIDNAALTADAGMAKVLQKYGIEVTLIQNGGISLPPHEFGFIGGACGVYDGKVYFFGNIDSHPSADIIKSFCKKHSHEIICLSSEPLVDLGGMIFVD